MSAPHDDREAAPPGLALVAAASAAARRHADALAAACCEGPTAWGHDDETRARTALVIDAVLEAIVTMLRRAEPALDAAPLDDPFDRFLGSGLIHRSGLAGQALARADEYRLGAALARALAADPPIAARLDPVDGAFGGERLAVHAAEAARIDRVGDPLLPLAEVSAEDRHALLWQVAALLAEDALAAQGAARSGNEDATHRAAAAAVGRGLAAIDDADGIGPAAMRLAHAVAATAPGIDDALVAATLAIGRIAQLAALLAVRGGIAFEEARAMLLSADRAAVLLRACDVGRETAVALLLALVLAGEGQDDMRFAALIDGFDDLTIDAARAHVRRARFDPQYRDAIALLEGVR